MKYILRTLTLLCVVIGAAASARAQTEASTSANTKAPEPLDVGQGRARLLTLPYDITFFSAAPRGALQVRVVNARTLAITGRSSGRAHLVIQTAPRPGSQAQEVRLVPVEVRSDQAKAREGWASPGEVAAGALPVQVLSLRAVNQAGPAALVWTVDGLPTLKFRSLEVPSLREWISSLPEGSAIRWTWPPNLPPGSAPKVARELKSFAAFCHSEGIQLEGESLEGRQRLEPKLFSPEEGTAQ